MLGHLAATGLALAAPAHHPLRAGCIDVRPWNAEVDLTGRIEPRVIARPPIGPSGERNPPPALAYDLLLDPTVCIDDGYFADPDARLARVGLYPHDPAIMPLVRDAAGRRVRVRGQAMTSFSVDGFRPIMVVNVRAVEPADRSP